MKFNKWILAMAAVAALAISTPAIAQTNAPDNIEQFPATASVWLTSINTNYDWAIIDFQMQTGYKQLTGIGAASDLCAQYNGKARWNAGVDLQFSGVGSPINTFEVQAGYAVIQDGDVKLETNLRAGYTGTRSCAVIEPCVFLEKLMTKNTYAAAGVSLPIYTKGKFSTTPSFFIEAGFGHMSRAR